MPSFIRSVFFIIPIFVFLNYHPVHGICTYKGKNYSFEYPLPGDDTKKGTEFSCDLIRYLDKYEFLNETKFINLKTTDIPKIKFVTGFDQSHHRKAGTLLLSFKRTFPKEKIIVYDLGLKKKTVKKLIKYNYVNYRKFQFTDFPSHVKSLPNNAFKIIIISEMLKRYPYVMWVDSTFRFNRRNFLNDVNKLFSCNRNRTTVVTQPNAITEREKQKFPEIGLPTCSTCSPSYMTKGYNKSLFDFNVKNCYKSNILLTIPYKNGILSTIPNNLKKYILTDPTKFVDRTELQFTTGVILLMRTKSTINSVMYWALLCALTKDCIIPEFVPSKNCKYNFSNLFSKTYVCPAYDRALFTLLLHNANNYDYRNYITDIFNYGVYMNNGLKKWKKLRKG